MTVEDVKYQRIKLDGYAGAINRLNGSRELSLARTAAQASRMWLGQVLNAMNEAYPYPESKDPETGNYINSRPTDGGFHIYDGYTEIETIKCLRRDLDIVAIKLSWDKEYPDGYASWKKDEEIILALRLAKQYVKESCMWLGMELGRRVA